MTRRAFTVVELLVAMVITLIMMGAVATLLGTITGGVGASRATIEMTERMRSAASRLQQDLDGVTVTMLPPRRPESDEGYFELIEGLQSDRQIDDPSNSDPTVLLDPAAYPLLSRFGDCDDVLMFTTRTRGEPFIGKVPTSINASGTIQSQVAEVVYFLAPSPTSTAINPQYTLYRRCLLVVPSFQIQDGTTPQQMLEQYDISVRMVPGTNPQKWVANSLGDLTKRENRAAHVATFPHRVDFTQIIPFAGTRYGEDVILSNVLAFDATVYDPGVALKWDASKSYFLTPRDPGWTALASVYPTPPNEPQPYGAFVDLGYAPTFTNNATAPPMWFNAAPAPKSLLAAAYAAPVRHTYDTYSAHYENDGIDQPATIGGAPDGLIDLATNGFDDNNDGVVDDSLEAESAPPYAHPLRGVKVTVRVYEPDSRQIRELNIESDFTPE